MKILGLDSATTGCSAAVWSDGEILARRFEEMERGQAERLNPMIGEVMEECGLDFHGLDGIAVTVGPGAFTGLRIGLAVARALALAAPMPIIGITTFAALARAVPDAERSGRLLVIAVNGKRRDVYVEMTDSRGRIVTEATTFDPAAGPAALPGDPLLIAGDGGPQLRAAFEGCGEVGEDADARIRFSEAMGPPDAAHVASAGGAVLAGGGRHPVVPPRPLYVRAPDARLPGKRDGR